MKKQRKIFVEIQRVREICRRSKSYATPCAGCGGAEVDLVTFADAAQIAGTNVDKIIVHAARGELHLGLVPEALLVCLNSLLHVVKFSDGVRIH